RTRRSYCVTNSPQYPNQRGSGLSLAFFGHCFLARSRHWPIWLRHNVKASRFLSTLPYLPHRRVGNLEVAGETFAVEQWIALAIMYQLRFDAGKQRPITRQS